MHIQVPKAYYDKGTLRDGERKGKLAESAGSSFELLAKLRQEVVSSGFECVRRNNNNNNDNNRLE